MAHLIDWDAPPPARGGLLAFLRRVDRDWLPEQHGRWRPELERVYARALVRCANRAVLRDTLRRKESTVRARG